MVFVLFLHGLFLLMALAITFAFNWLASIVPFHVFEEFEQFVVPVIAIIPTFFVAATDDFEEMKPTPKPKYLARAILIGLVCFGAWYYFNHLRYTSEVISQLEEDYENPKQELYAAYEREFGVSGFWGYLLWSAKAGKKVSLSDDDSEPVKLDLPGGWFKFVMNWVYRVANLILVVVWVARMYMFVKRMTLSTSLAPTTGIASTASRSAATKKTAALVAATERPRPKKIAKSKTIKD